jgi:3-methyladenine DNA glycosylase AlkC
MQRTLARRKEWVTEKWDELTQLREEGEKFGYPSRHGIYSELVAEFSDAEKLRKLREKGGDNFKKAVKQIQDDLRNTMTSVDQTSKLKMRQKIRNHFLTFQVKRAAAEAAGEASTARKSREKRLFSPKKRASRSGEVDYNLT